MMESNDVSGSFSLSFSMSPDHAPKMHLNKKTVEVVEKTGVDMFGKTNGFKPTGVSFGTGSYILTGMFLGSIVVVIYVARLVVQRNTTTTSNKSMLQNYSNDPSSSSHIITTGGQ